MDITHLHLHVRDRARAADFYRRWFGLSTRREGDDITFLCGSRGFLLALMDDADAVPPPPWFHFGIALPSLDAVKALHASMREANVPIAKPWHEDQRVASFRCRDPDGYAVEIYWEA
jgi:catechol-2,3-dioxygenase